MTMSNDSARMQGLRMCVGLRGLCIGAAHGHNYAKLMLSFRVAGALESGHLKGGMCEALRGGHIEGDNWKLTFGGLAKAA